MISKRVSTSQKDLIASNLRSQISSLKTVLEDMEGSEKIEESYAFDSLKRIEKNLRYIRKLYANNINFIGGN